MLEELLDKGLAAKAMLPHISALLPTLVSGLVTALESTPGAADDAAPAATTYCQPGSTPSQSSNKLLGAGQDKGKPEALIRLINKLIVKVGRITMLVVRAAPGSHPPEARC
jgi:hypothetical protein